MKITKYLTNACGSLWRNKLRSTLSTLGIVIGIASVSIMMSLGEGLKKQMLESLSVSNDTISIVPKMQMGGNPNEKGMAPPQESGYLQIKEILTPKTIEDIKKHITNIRSVAGYWYANGGGAAKYQGKEIYAQTVWLTEEYFRAKRINILYGMGFSKAHFENRSKVVVLGNDLVKNDFEGKNPIGKQIMIGGYAFDIIGVLDKTTDYGVSYSISMPFTTSESSLWVKTLNGLYVFCDDIGKMGATKKDVLYLLMKLSGANSPDTAKFSMESNDEVIKQINETIGQFKLFLWGIAGISLFVWGIGIMNIMLVSVVERTREIGIRKAIGAKKRDILLQFLIESIVISILWCVIALGLTILWVYLINTYAPEGFRAIFNIEVVIFASAISIWMGVVFGLLPAWKAAKMRPIDALRFE